MDASDTRCSGSASKNPSSVPRNFLVFHITLHVFPGGRNDQKFDLFGEPNFQ